MQSGGGHKRNALRDRKRPEVVRTRENCGESRRTTTKTISKYRRKDRSSWYVVPDSQTTHVSTGPVPSTHPSLSLWVETISSFGWSLTTRPHFRSPSGLFPYLTPTDLSPSPITHTRPRISYVVVPFLSIGPCDDGALPLSRARNLLREGLLKNKTKGY